MDMAPVGASEDWYDYRSGDAMLVAKKNASWNGFANPKEYTFRLPDLDALSTGFVERSGQKHLGQRPAYLPDKPANKRTWAYVEYRILLLVRSLFKKIDPKGEGWRTLR